jgi:hypothetical protein
VATNPISPEVLRFIARYIHSVEHLEVLCLLNSNRAKAWTVAEVLHEIQSSKESVSYCLRKFQNDGFVVSNDAGMFRFSPTTQGVADVVEELAETYRERRVTVVEMIYKRPSDPGQNFAEAFRFRKDK